MKAHKQDTCLYLSFKTSAVNYFACIRTISKGVFSENSCFATVRHPGSESDQINVFADIHYPRLVLLYVGGLIRESLELNQNTDRNENRNCLHI